MDRSWRVSTRPDGRVLLLLIVAVLVGLLGMHGLAAEAVPVGMPTSASENGPVTGHAVPHRMDVGHPAMERGESAADPLCHHHSGGGHEGHAVADCAATGVGAAYLPPAPAFRPCEPVAFTVATWPGASAERAPPDLAQLQLLRI